MLIYAELYQESERISAENFVKFCEEVGYEERSGMIGPYCSPARRLLRTAA